MDSYELKTSPLQSWRKFPQQTPQQSKFPNRFVKSCGKLAYLHKNVNILSNVPEEGEVLSNKSSSSKHRVIFQKKLIAEKSFEVNQSFPRLAKTKRWEDEIVDSSPLLYKLNKMDKIRVDGAHGLRFSARRSKGAFTPCSESPYNNNAFLNSASESLVRVPKSGINPNKAVFTIDSKSSQILIVNHRATELLGYSSRELCDMQLTDLLTQKKKLHVFALAEGHLNSEDGTMVLLSGKVVEINTKSQHTIAVSLWIRQIEGENSCCLAVAEPVERRVAQITIDSRGAILSGDYEAALLFQFESPDQINGLEIAQLIPAILLPQPNSNSSGGAVTIPKHIYKQKATGRTQEAVAFPLCLMIQQQLQNESSASSTDSGIKSDTSTFVITIWVFTNISGLLVIDENGNIESCNHHFSMFMFGYPQNKMIGREIFHVIPNFGKDTEYLEYSRSRGATVSSLEDDESETETDLYNDNNPLTEGVRRVYLDFSSPKVNYPISAATTLNDSNVPCSNMKSTVSEPLNLLSSHNSSNNGFASLKYNNLTHLSDNKFKEPLQPASDLAHCENSENNKNAANIGSQKPQATQTSSVAGDNYETAINESDLLTPVNELPHLVASASEATVDSSPSENQESASYHTADISSALKIQSPCYVPLDQNIPNCSLNTPNNKRLAKIESKNVITSTPTEVGGRTAAMVTSVTAKRHFVDGKYKGEAIHQDGNVIDVLYTISNQVLPCGRRVYCVWINRDPDSEYNKQRDEEDDDDDDKHQNNLTLTFNSITSTVDNSLGQVIKTAACSTTTVGAQFSRPHSVSLVSQCEDDQISGNFSKYYTTLKQIGKGAYGYVKMAYRNTDRLLVIAKFILKEKLRPNFIIKTDDDFDVPMEIYLLTKVEHPNIVDILDVYENEKFYQMVMEKHGAGMDLFEFIDRCPDMDEKLGCFIFRQIVDAVDYLHSLNILHRDIKDENIIIDHNFHIKLIDFGSATFMQKGKLFSTFYGTTEYCSPEVLKGNKYAGPELEVWSLGVTLYVLIFFENPFLDIEETLKAEFSLLSEVSSELENLLGVMLEKDPKKRITVKQMKDDPWITQEIDESSFNFATLVPCEHHEINPEKYYTGTVYVSNTILSTTSSHDSLSLVDDSSSIGVDSCESDTEDCKDKEKKGKGKASANKGVVASPSPSKSTKPQDGPSGSPPKAAVEAAATGTTSTHTTTATTTTSLDNISRTIADTSTMLDNENSIINKINNNNQDNLNNHNKSFELDYDGELYDDENWEVEMLDAKNSF